MIVCEMLHQAPLEQESYTTIEETQADMLLLTRDPVKVTSNTSKKPKTQLVDTEIVLARLRATTTTTPL